MRVVKVAPKRFVMEFRGETELHELLAILAILRSSTPEGMQNIEHSKQEVLFELLSTEDSNGSIH